MMNDELMKNAQHSSFIIHRLAGGQVSAIYGLEKFSHLEDKIYRTIEQFKRERQEREALEREVLSLRRELSRTRSCRKAPDVSWWPPELRRDVGLVAATVSSLLNPRTRLLSPPATREL